MTVYDTEKSRSEKIAELNDAFRQSFEGGKVVTTQGITALPPEKYFLVLGEVRTFNDFTEDNDPYGEHDFGACDVEGVGKIFWKIDYYAPDMKHGSEDPTDPEKTVRVLTVMFSNEY